MSATTDITIIIALTLFLEAITILGRLVFGSAKQFYKKHKLIRIHHGYLGVVLILAYSLFFKKEIALIIGLPLLLSDTIHHFVVLPI